FSVLNAQSGAWQERKRQWLALGIRSELGRGEELNFTGEAAHDLDVYRHRKPDAKTFGSGGPGTLGAQFAANGNAAKKQRGRKPTATIFATGPSPQQLAAARGYHAQPGGGPSKKSVWLGSNGKPVGGNGAINARSEEDEEGTISQTGTSVFDPVLCELYYRWHSPKEGLVLDPFAGGSVRGIVAAALGRTYAGMDLRAEQIEENEDQAWSICNRKYEPLWLRGDSSDIVDRMDELAPGKRFDTVFSCPPYFDLELYSGDKRDLSNTTWDEFRKSYAHIIKQTTSLLAENRFACFVVGDIRDKDGLYRGLPSLTTQCFEEAGCRLYNQAILITAVGSLTLRVARQFSVSRKLGNSHQHVLVFVKGDPRKAAAACESVEELLECDFPGLKDEKQLNANQAVRA